MVTREVHSTIPPRVEYSLTALGTLVAENLRTLADLLEASADGIGASRATYDEARATA